ncbi:MAG TPA: GNAT family N-acetyltransferase [Caldimonas sp.]
MPDFPKTMRLKDGTVLLRLMTPADGPALLRFASGLPAHDLLFLRRDIMKQDGIDAWIADIARGRITSVLALGGDEVLGYATVHRTELDWSRHVAEVRVLVSPRGRGRDLGRLLVKTAFAVALEQGVEKLFARMTLDQMGARTLFEELGFLPEALLKDEVKDRNGKKHDLLILSHDITTSAALEGFLAE